MNDRRAKWAASLDCSMAVQIEAPLIGRAGARPAPLSLALEMTCLLAREGEGVQFNGSARVRFSR